MKEKQLESFITAAIRKDTNLREALIFHASRKHNNVSYPITCHMRLHFFIKVFAISNCYVYNNHEMDMHVML